VGYEALRAEVQFEQADDNDATPVTIKVNVTGLTVGFYGFHIHQLGDISSAFPMNNVSTHTPPQRACLLPSQRRFMTPLPLGHTDAVFLDLWLL